MSEVRNKQQFNSAATMAAVNFAAALSAQGGCNGFSLLKLKLRDSIAKVVKYRNENEKLKKDLQVFTELAQDMNEKGDLFYSDQRQTEQKLAGYSGEIDRLRRSECLHCGGMSAQLKEMDSRLKSISY